MAAGKGAMAGALAGMGRLTELRQRLCSCSAPAGLPHWHLHPGARGQPRRLAVLFDQQRGTILDMFNMFSGGALERASLFALGIMPYISASIIVQLMTSVVPALEQLKKEGEAGRRKITQYTRYGTVVLATFQASASPSPCRISRRRGFRWWWRRVTDSCSPRLSLVTGTMFLMWLGEQITERGLGNGISMIIFAGIVAGLPQAIGGTMELVRTGEMNPSGGDHAVRAGDRR
jgi:preprotein translocase subunit SecY